MGQGNDNRRGGNRGGSNRRGGRDGGGFNRGGGRDGGGYRDGGGFNRGGDRGGFNRGPKEMHKAICAECGKECEVPFKPKEGRPVYCKECFQKHRE